jgi:hypothetical protein
VYELSIVRYMYVCTHTLFASFLFGMHELFLFLLQYSLYACDRNFSHTPKDDRIMSECIVCVCNMVVIFNKAETYGKEHCT